MREKGFLAPVATSAAALDRWMLPLIVCTMASIWAGYFPAACVNMRVCRYVRV